MAAKVIALVKHDCPACDRLLRVLDALAAAGGYVSGDSSEAAIFHRVKELIGAVRGPVFYLEIPPSLFEAAVRSIAEALSATWDRIAAGRSPHRPSGRRHSAG